MSSNGPTTEGNSKVLRLLVDACCLLLGKARGYGVWQERDRGEPPMTASKLHTVFVHQSNRAERNTVCYEFQSAFSLSDQRKAPEVRSPCGVPPGFRSATAKVRFRCQEHVHRRGDTTAPPDSANGTYGSALAAEAPKRVQRPSLGSKGSRKVVIILAFPKLTDGVIHPKMCQICAAHGRHNDPKDTRKHGPTLQATN